MGIEALVPRLGTSKAAPGHKIYPYLLRGVSITKPNHVWASDITYIPMALGFLYLMAIIDWATRAVLAWRLSNTMDTGFCIAALDEALAPTPLINSRFSHLDQRLAVLSYFAGPPVRAVPPKAWGRH